MNSFLGVFAKSPIKPMIEHMDEVHCCAEALKEFFKAVYAKDWRRQKPLVVKLLHEQKADELKRKIRLNLPSGLSSLLNVLTYLSWFLSKTALLTRPKIFQVL